MFDTILYSIPILTDNGKTETAHHYWANNATTWLARSHLKINTPHTLPPFPHDFQAPSNSNIEHPTSATVAINYKIFSFNF